MRVEQITVADKIEQVAPLLAENQQETEHSIGTPLAVNMQQYAALEAAGLVIGLAVYEGDAIVGYAVTLLVPRHLHYDFCYASNMVLFVSKRHRASSAGLRLIRETERLAKERGAKLVVWTAKPATPAFALFAALGYEPHEALFHREL